MVVGLAEEVWRVINRYTEASHAKHSITEGLNNAEALYYFVPTYESYHFVGNRSELFSYESTWMTSLRVLGTADLRNPIYISGCDKTISVLL